MQYEPIKRSLGKFFSGAPYKRKLLYSLVDLLLLRTWHVKKSLRLIGLKLSPDASVLDAGSGMGQYSWRMCRMNPGWHITGIDINSTEVADGNDFFGRTGKSEKVKFITGDLTTFRKPDSFDLILSVDVMEHINDDEKVFGNFFSSLKDKGYLLISTPSDRGGSDVHESEDESFIGEHVRNGYSTEEIRSKLSRAGFTSISTEYTYGTPGSISWKLSMKYPVKMLNLSKLFFILLPFYYIIIFPIALILNFFDVRFRHSTGTGLLVTAQKEIL